MFDVSLLVVARVEGERDDVGDRVDREAREDHSGAPHRPLYLPQHRR